MIFSKNYRRVFPTFAPAYYAMGWLDVRLNHLGDARRQFERSLGAGARLDRRTL